MMVGEVIQVLKAAVPNMPEQGPLSGSNDTLKAGREETEVTGIVTTFLATAGVIERAAALGANLIITHEPTFYHHDDTPATFPGDAVLEQKAKALAAHDIAVFRYHDFWHMHQPDGIYTGVVRQTGWQAHLEEGSQHVFVLPPTSLRDVAAQIKKMFGVDTVRVVGDERALHQRVGLFVGSPGPYWQLPSVTNDKLDLLVCGEVSEWELAEYVRDARTYGHALGLIIVGHQPTEEAGMAYLAEWLEPKLLGVHVTHVPSGYPLTTI